MVPTYNGWEDSPEDEREALELWEAEGRKKRRSSQSMLRPDSLMVKPGWGENL